MAVQIAFNGKELNDLQEAVRRSPDKVKSEVKKFLVRGMAVYKSIIFNNPWRMGASGGGAPVSQAGHGGNLRATHETNIQPWQATIKPTAPYAAYVHGIDGFPRKRSYQLRPWLDYAMEKGSSDVDAAQDEMLSEIVSDLAK